MTMSRRHYVTVAVGIIAVLGVAGLAASHLSSPGTSTSTRTTLSSSTATPSISIPSGFKCPVTPQPTPKAKPGPAWLFDGACAVFAGQGQYTSSPACTSDPTRCSEPFVLNLRLIVLDHNTTSYELFVDYSLLSQNLDGRNSASHDNATQWFRLANPVYPFYQRPFPFYNGVDKISGTRMILNISSSQVNLGGTPINTTSYDYDFRLSNPDFNLANFTIYESQKIQFPVRFDFSGYGNLVTHEDPFGGTILLTATDIPDLLG